MNPDSLSRSGHPYDTTMPCAVKRAYVDAAYGQLHYHVAGTSAAGKTPVLLLHMSPKNARQWRQPMSFLAGNYHVLAPDYPGYGESDPPPAEPHVSIEDYAAAMWQFVDAVAIGPVDLVGIHTGSMVAVEMARTRPEQVRRIVQFSAPMFNEDELTALRAQFENPLPLDEQGSRFSIMWQRIVQYAGPQADKVWAAWNMRDNIMGGEAYEYGHRAAFNYCQRYADYVLQVAHPMLVVNPQDDCFEATRRFHRLWPECVYVEKPEWQGAGFLDYNAADVARFIGDFLV